MCAQPLKTLAPDAQPHPELQAATLSHMHLRVDDLDVAQTFYETHFGWKPIMELPWQARHMRFMRDQRGFLLVLELHPDKAPMPSWFHLGFQLPSRVAIRDAAAYFQKQGVQLLDTLKDDPGYATFTIEDPDGYHLQIFFDAETPERAPD
jgi:catechol 2,3-dioxygenase-like lactoylglutathione lyase family enzyme